MTNLDNSSKTSPIKINKTIFWFSAVSLIGFLDALYLTVASYNQSISCNVVEGCQTVLFSQYAQIFGIPIALFGTIYYLFILISSLVYLDSPKKFIIKILSFIPWTAFVFSMWLVYLQIFYIEAICQYCMLSALTSTILFILSLILIKKQRTPKNSA